MKITDILTGPEKWTKGALARSETGQTVYPTDEGAKCFCLIGAIIRAYPPELDSQVRQKIFAVLDPKEHNISTWQDAPETTFEMVLEVARKAGV